VGCYKPDPPSLQRTTWGNHAQPATNATQH